MANPAVGLSTREDARSKGCKLNITPGMLSINRQLLEALAYRLKCSPRTLS